MHELVEMDRLQRCFSLRHFASKRHFSSSRPVQLLVVGSHYRKGSGFSASAERRERLLPGRYTQARTAGCFSAVILDAALMIEKLPADGYERSHSFCVEIALFNSGTRRVRCASLMCITSNKSLLQAGL